MSNGIFASNAPAYWEQGLPVIPLVERSKRPIPINWSEFAEKLPPLGIQTQWVTAYPNANMGLVLGRQSGIVMLDIDIEKQETIELIEGLLHPISPWSRVGKKGKVYAFRYQGERTFRIHSRNEGSIVELLSDRTQVVLPPSIHPDTNKPYTANVSLLDVHRSLPTLPEDFEDILREALSRAGYDLSTSGHSKITEMISVGARDNQMTRHAGLIARDIFSGSRTLLEGLGEMDHWCDTFVQKVAGDPIDKDKGQRHVVEFLRRDLDREGGRKTLPVGWDAGLTDEDKKKMGFVDTDELEQWTFTRIREYLVREFEKYPDEDHPGIAAAVDYALERMAKSPSLTTIEVDRLLNWIQTTARMPGLRLSSLKGQLKELQAPGIAGTNHTEIAEMALERLETYGEIRFAAGGFWQYRGSHWEELDRDVILREISQEYGSFPAAKRRNDHTGILGVLTSLCARPLTQSGLKGINFANGFLTPDLDLVEAQPDHGCTYTLPFLYRPELAGKCPKFFDLLHTSWGEDADYQEKVQAMQEAICATLFGLGPNYQRAILLYGAPGSGKTQIINIVKGLMPDGSTCSISPNDWSDRFRPSAMYGKLMNFAGELSEHAFIDGQMFKTIVEGSEIPGEKKGGQIFMFRPSCTNWFGSNHVPKTRDTSDGFNRRWLIFHFKRKVPVAKKIVNFSDHVLAEEREAIVAWAIQAIGRLRQKQDYTLPESHLDAVRDMSNRNNSVRYFLTASPSVRIIPSWLAETAGNQTTAFTTKQDLYDAYSTFSVLHGSVRRAGSQLFHSMMLDLQAELGFSFVSEKDKSKGTIQEYYTNIILVEQKRF